MTDTSTHAHAYHPDQPSDWIVRWAQGIKPRGTVLDLACGSGRHSRFLAKLGLRVCAIDRDARALDGLDGVEGVTVRQADLENGDWPLHGLTFDAIVVANYLHRPLFAQVFDSLAPAGVLIYETFAVGNERFGKPSNPQFLLRAGELLDVVRGRLRVIAYEDIEVAAPRPACIQRICAAHIRGEV